MVKITRLNDNSEFLVNTQMVSDQRNSQIAVLDDGKFVVTWEDWSELGDGSEASVKAQIYNEDGSAFGEEFLVNNLTDARQFLPSITALDNGGFTITWTSTVENNHDVQHADVKGQIFDAAGNKIGDEFFVNSHTHDDQEFTSISSLPNGGFVAVWQDYGRFDSDKSEFSIRAQIFDDQGQRVGNDFQVNTTEHSGQWSAHVSTFSDGGFVVVYGDLSEKNYFHAQWNVKGQIFDSAGNPVGNEFQINPETEQAELHEKVNVTVLANDDFVVTWHNAANSSTDLSAQLYDSSGMPKGDQFTITDFYGSEYGYSLESLPDGKFIVTWTGGDGHYQGVSAQIFGPDGAKIGDEIEVNTETHFRQLSPDIDTQDDGSFIITWIDYSGKSDSSGTGIKAQMFDADGNKVGSPVTIELAVTENEENAVREGTITFTDQNVENAHEFSYTEGGEDYLGSFSVYETDSAQGDGRGALTWEFDGSGIALDTLSEGEIVEQTYSIIVEDSEGGTDTQDVSITLTGVNDAPEATVIDGGAVSEDAENIEINLLETASDVDNGATLHIENLVVTASDGREVEYTIDENGVVTVDPAQFQDLAGSSLAANALYFNDGDIDDEIGQNGDATLSNGVYTGTAPNGAPALELDGSITGGPNIDLSEPIGGAMTVSIYARFDDLSASEWQRVFDFGNGAGVDELSLQQGGDSDGMVLSYQNGYVGNWVHLSMPGQITEGEWAHWTVTITEDGLAKVFKDGELIGQRDGFYIPSVDRGDMFVGHSPFAGEAQLDGAVSTFQYLDYALTDEQVAELYENGGVSENPSENVTLTMTYDVVDEYGASVENTATLTVEGQNDAPEVEEALTASILEDTQQTFDLLAGATDVDNGDILSVDMAGVDLPAGFTFDETTNQLSFDASHEAYRDLNEGETQDIEIGYYIQDSYGAQVEQSITITVEGINVEGERIKGTHRADHLQGTVNDDKIFGLRGRDKVFADDGNDYIHTGRGHDQILGGDGNDTVFAGRGNDYVLGENGNDNLFGGAGHDRIWGGNGDDRLGGGTGHDALNGGDGNDVLFGGRGKDMLNGGQGDDLLSGGNGADVFVFTGASGHDIIQDFDARNDAIFFETVSVSNFDQISQMASQDGNNTIIQFDDGSVTIENFTIDQLAEDMFIF